MKSVLKAYSVQADEHGCVVFSASGVVARREGANQLDCEFSDVKTCRRAPEFDEYADAGKVPVLSLLEAGWWWPCQNCETHVMDDGDEYVIHDERVYCCEPCRDADLADHIMSKRRNQALTDCAHEKWPGITVQFASDFRGDGTVSFTFPGGAHLANWHTKGNLLYVPLVDHPAWAAFTGRPVQIRDQKAAQ